MRLAAHDPGANVKGQNHEGVMGQNPQLCIYIYISMDWFKGKSTGNHRLSHQIWGFPVNFTLIQSIDIYIYMWNIIPTAYGL